MISVIDYGGGNLFSVLKALQSLGAEVQVIKTPAEYEAGKIIIPGVGAFGEAMQQLQVSGFDRFLQAQAQANTAILGICLGMQILFAHSEEAPETAGLGFFPESVVRFPESDKVPHMGWNQIFPAKESQLLAGLAGGEFVYFAHSFCVPQSGKAYEAAVCEYSLPFVAVVEQENLFGVQFHPEKSHTVGMKILKNFVEL